MSSANQEGYPKCLSLRTSVIFCSLPFSLAQIRMNTDHLRYRKLEPTDHMQEHCLTVLTAAEIDDDQCTEPYQLSSEEHTSEPQSLMRISYAVFCLKKQTHQLLTSQHNKH